MSAAVSIARMMRPPLGLLTALGAAASLAIIAPHSDPGHFITIAAAVFCVTSGGYLINDVFDVERDRITHPERPLPSGNIRWTTALVASVAFLAAGLVAALPLGSEATLVVAVNIALLVAYSPIRTWSGILGNVLTAYLCASIAVLGGVTGRNLQPLLPAIVFVFFANLARETILDLNDAEGDRAAGLSTAPIVFGTGAVFRFAWSVLALLALFFVAIASFADTARPFLFLTCLLGSLALFAVGLRRYQDGRDPASFHSFKTLGRWAFALSIPGFLAGGLPLGAQTSPSSAVAVGPYELPAFLAYALAGVGLTFFFIANALISDYNRESQQMWTRIDARWRFYALFTCLNYVFFFQCVAFALRILPDLSSSWWAVFIFVNGFVPFPVVWLELVYSKSSRELGFTRYYEQNCWEVHKKKISDYYDAQEAFRRKESTKPWEKLFMLERFVRVWLFIYLWKPLFGFHLRRDLHNPDLEDMLQRRLQLAQDILVILTNWLFIFGFVVFVVGFSAPKFARATLQPLSPWAILLFVALLISSVVLAFISWLQSTEFSVSNGFPVAFLAVYALALCYDLMRSGLLGGGLRLHNQFLGYLEAFGGGLTPLTLLGILPYLIWNFLHQLSEARRLSRQSAALADFALHRFGNLLTPPRLALQQVDRELKSPEALAKLGADAPRQEEVRQQISNAMGALDNARDILLDLQLHARHSWQEHWYSLSDLLLPLAQTETQEIDGIRRQIEVKVEPGHFQLDVYVDRKAFDDVLRNLVENGRHAIEKASRREGEVYIWADYKIGAFYPLCLSVRDNGTGIEDAVRARMYNIGFTTKPQGSGIGLFVVWEFVQRIQGDIRVDTSTGANPYTRFSLLFPLDRVRLKLRSSQKVDSWLLHGSEEG